MKKKLILEDLRTVNGNPDHSFRVKKVVNSIDYKVGEILSSDTIKNDVLAYVDDDNSWSVELVQKS